MKEAIRGFLSFNINDWMPLAVICSHLPEYSPIEIEECLEEMSKEDYDQYHLNYIYQTKDDMYACTSYHPSEGCLKYIKKELDWVD